MYNDFLERLDQIKLLLQKINSSNYIFKNPALDNHSIGSHCRHILEFVECLVNQYDLGIVDYEKRKRNSILENNKDYAIEFLDNLYQQILKPDKILSLATKNKNGEIVYCSTTYCRELIYNLEHCIHHEALIKVSLQNQSISHLVSEEFGYATSTIKAKEKKKYQEEF